MDLFTRHGVPGSWESGRGGRNKAKVLEVSAKDQAWADAMTAILTKTEAGRGPGTEASEAGSRPPRRKSPLSPPPRWPALYKDPTNTTFGSV